VAAAGSVLAHFATASAVRKRAVLVVAILGALLLAARRLDDPVAQSFTR
jgi:hypothetical protein